MTVIQIGVLVAQLVILGLGYFTVYRHRAVYSIVTEVLRTPTGTQNDRYI